MINSAAIAPLPDSDKRIIVAFTVLLLLFAFCPLYAPALVVDKLTLLFIYVLFAVMWNLLAGYAGLVSVGQQAFIGLGGYAMIRLVESGMPPFTAIFIGALLVGIVAWLLSFFLLRLKAGEFAIATWVVAETIRSVVMFDPIIQGETGTSLLALNSYDPDFRRNAIYFFALFSTAGGLTLTWYLLRSRLGAQSQAIRDDEEAAASVGISTFKVKQIIFILAAIGCALAGTLWLASAITYQPRTAFGVQWSVFMLFMVLVGGLGSFLGPVLGAVLFFTLQQLFGDLGAWYLAGIGIVAIVFSLYLPQGLVGLWVSRGRAEPLSMSKLLQMQNLPVKAPQAPEKTELTPSTASAIETTAPATQLPFNQIPDSNESRRNNMFDENLNTAGLFIGDHYRESSNGERRPVFSPANGQQIGSIAWGTTQDVDAAVAAARTAFDSGVWSGLSGRERGRIMLKAVQLMRDRQEELAQIESADVGKPILFARIIDAEDCINQFEYFATMGNHMDGSVREIPADAHAYVRKEPLGVVAAITPFNFPMILAATKIAPALIAGNCVVHKPSQETSLSAIAIAKIFNEAGLPEGVLNVVTGEGSVLGNHLVRHPGVDKIAFTGSTKTGCMAASAAGETMKPFTAELGGNAANIVFADANLDKAIGTIINAFVFNTGQFCMGGPRLLVERPIYETVLGILGNAVPNVPIGDIKNPETIIGPLATKAQFEKVNGLVERAKAAGAKVICGGKPLDWPGYWYPPTVLADLANSAEIVQEEVFGPVLTVQPFDTEAQAIEMANSTRYGLSAGVQSENIRRAHRVSAALEAGIVWVNGWSILDPSVPFGGVKASGYGRESGPEALASYQRSKSIVFDLSEPEPQTPPELPATKSIKTTRAAVLNEPMTPFSIEDVELAQLKDNEVLVKMVATGLCHTDLGVWAGGIPFPLPGVIGHEGAGIVEEVGSAVTSVKKGDHVVMSYTSCGGCGNCEADLPSYCETWLPRNLVGGNRIEDGSPTITRDGKAIGGHFFAQSSFAEHAIAEERNVVVVDRDVDLKAIAPLGCGVMTGFGSVWNTMNAKPGDRIAIFGAGAVGLSALIAAHLRKPLALIAVDVVDERLALARSLGATHVINGKSDNVAEQIMELTGGAGLTGALDTTGVPSVARSAVDALGAKGHLVVAAAPPTGTEIPVDFQGILPGKNISGVTMGGVDPKAFIPELVALVKSGELPLDRLTKQYRLETINEAVKDMHEGRTVKPVIVYD